MDDRPIRSSDIRVEAADRSYRSFADVDDPLAFAVASMRHAISLITDGKSMEARATLVQAQLTAEYAMNRDPASKAEGGGDG